MSLDVAKPIKWQEEDYDYTILNPLTEHLNAFGYIFADNEDIRIDKDGQGNLQFRDIVSGGPHKLSDLLESASGGITESQHRGLDQLTHIISEDSYTEIIRSYGKVLNVTIWTDNSKTTKIREVDLSRTSGKVSQIITKQYDVIGTLIETYTETITRTNGRITSIDGVLT